MNLKLTPERIANLRNALACPTTSDLAYMLMSKRNMADALDDIDVLRGSLRDALSYVFMDDTTAVDDDWRQACGPVGAFVAGELVDLGFCERHPTLPWYRRKESKP